MTAHATARKILAAAVLAASLVSCSTAPTPAPTVDAQPTFNAIYTQGAQTMVANLTMNAPTSTPVTPVTPTSTPTLTSTPAPTSTPQPSNTPGPTETPTHVYITWTFTPTPTQPAFACIITGVSPSSSDKITVDQDFDAKWSLKNSGTATWTSANSDFRFIDGTRLHTKGDIVDLKSNVAPNGTTSISMDMKAPSGDGTYTTKWGLYMDDGSVCTLSLKINVTK